MSARQPQTRRPRRRSAVGRTPVVCAALLLGILLLTASDAAAAPKPPEIGVKPHGKTVRAGDSYKFGLSLRNCDKRDVEWHMLPGAIGDLDDNGTYEAPRNVNKVYEFYIEVRHKRLRHIFDRARVIVIPKNFDRPDDPELKRFRASKTKIRPGEPVELSWEAEKADYVTIEPGAGRLPVQGKITVRPLVTTEYTCTAFKQYWQDFDRIRIDVESGPMPPGAQKPRVKSLDVNPDRTTPGRAVTIRWDTERATAIRLISEMGEQYVPASGQVQYTPTDGGQQTITLEASNPFGVDSKDVTLQVADMGHFRPEIQVFTATPDAVPIGAPVTLTYRTRNARRVYLLEFGRRRLLASEDGQVDVYPLQSGQYTLEAENLLGKVAAAVQVRVLPAPPPRPPLVQYFQADPTVLFGPGPVQLSWKVVGADTVDVVGWRNDNVAQGDLTAYATASRQFVLRATNRAGVTEARCQVEVRQLAPPQIVVFSATPGQLFVGQKTLLAWQVTDATRVDLQDAQGRWQQVNPADALEVTFNAPGNYSFHLVARGAGGQVEATADVTALALPGPEILRFDADRRFVAPGESVTLTWVTQRAPAVWIANVTGMLPASGSQAFRLTDNTDFQLVARGADGRTQTATVSVRVRPVLPLFPVIEQFSITPTEVFEGQPVTATWRVRNATNVKLASLDLGNELAGTRTFIPPASGNYVLSASSLLKTVTQTLSVVVRPLPKPDLAVVDIRRGFGGRPTFTIQNLGTAPVNQDFDIDVFLGSTRTETIRYSVQRFGALGPNAAVTIAANQTALPAGPATVTVRADSANAVPESREDNNDRAVILR